MSKQSRVKSFHVAAGGLKHAFFTQPNFQIQVLLGMAVVIAAWVVGFSRGEWLILILTIGLVLTAELINTVVEVVVDLAVKEQLIPEAKLAKDVAAAAVLLSSLVALAVGVILFYPYF